LSLVSSLDPERYMPRKYYISEGDTLSAEKVIAMENKLAPVDYEDPEHIIPYTITIIPRARRVHQPLLTTPFSAFRAFLHCLWYTSRIGNQPNLVLMNGPGTCVVLCAAVYLHKVCKTLHLVWCIVIN
jgi:beta-1,4-N-acetylglucosaminyltransferase